MPDIIPSVGRKVWFYRNTSQQDPFDATVISVHDTEPHAGTPVNLYVIDPGGSVEVHKGIVVGQDGDDFPHYRWMPYQQTQQAEADAEAAAKVTPPTFEQIAHGSDQTAAKL